MDTALLQWIAQRTNKQAVKSLNAIISRSLQIYRVNLYSKPSFLMKSFESKQWSI